MEQQTSKPRNLGPLVISMILVLLGLVISLHMVRLAHLQKDSKERAVAPPDKSLSNHAVSSARRKFGSPWWGAALSAVGPRNQAIGKKMCGIGPTEGSYEENTDLIGRK